MRYSNYTSHWKNIWLSKLKEFGNTVKFKHRILLSSFAVENKTMKLMQNCGCFFNFFVFLSLWNSSSFLRRWHNIIFWLKKQGNQLFNAFPFQREQPGLSSKHYLIGKIWATQFELHNCGLNPESYKSVVRQSNISISPILIPVQTYWYDGWNAH